MIKPPRSSAAAFTVVELLVVIGIIVLLVGLLIPLVGRLQTNVRVTDTRSFIAQLSSAIDRYYSDFKAYPGPISNDEVYHPLYGTASFPTGAFNSSGGAFNDGFQMVSATGFAGPDGDNVDGRARITMSENLVLGLLGGLKLQVTGTPPRVRLVYDPSLVGRGPLSLNPANPRPYEAYIEPKHLSWRDVTVGGSPVKTGAFVDDASSPDGADDSIIPEFVDQFSDPMPILYVRAKRGAATRNNTVIDNPVITHDPGGNTRRGQYDLSQFIAYTGASPSIGVGKKLPTYIENGSAVATPSPPTHGLRTVNPQHVLGPSNSPQYWYPYTAFPYFRDPSLSGSQDSGNFGQQVARQKDRYMLISAGPDRIYGTSDDITSFGSIAP